MNRMPRIQKVAASTPTILDVKWKGGGQTEHIDLAGWIATGGDALAPLRNPDLFSRPFVDDYGASVAWDDDDLRIDAVHLALLAQEQRPFAAREAARWQDEMGLSNREVAEFLGIAVSTWNAYKSTGNVPSTVAILCRAARRDPILMQAHYRPRRPAGRPRKSA
jgi:hypothetical protein